MHIKNTLLLTLLLSFQSIFAQKFGYIDSDHILSKMPEYNQAQQEINTLARSWQKEIEAMQSSVDSLYNVFDREKILLTEKMKNEKLAEIRKREAELAIYQKKIFGFEGLFFLKKQELIKPLQDKVFEAVKKVARTKKLAIIFDKAGELIMVYTDPTHDYTDFVLEALALGDPNDQIK